MEEKKDTIGSGTVGGARRAMPAVPEPAAATGPVGPNQRWTVTRKRELALRLLRGESMEALARELGVEIYGWRSGRTRPWQALMPAFGSGRVIRWRKSCSQPAAKSAS
jgi:hypothetical protein